MTRIGENDDPTFGRKRRQPTYQTGKLIVRVREDALKPALAEDGVRALRSGRSPLPDVISNPLKYLRANAGLTDVAPIFSTSKRSLRHISGPATRQNAGIV